MSTKIYDAYRIRKDNVGHITTYLRDMQKQVYQYVLNNESLLRKIHVLSYRWAMSQEDEEYKDAFEEGYFFRPIINFLEESEQCPVLEPRYKSMRFTCSVAEDDTFWYIKFFANEPWQREIYNDMVEGRDDLLDYHYQNQSDSPDGISQPKFDARGAKWDEVMLGRNNYKGVLSYIFFDADEFQRMLLRDKENLAYNFKQNVE